jgi:hypothetical protein
MFSPKSRASVITLGSAKMPSRCLDALVRSSPSKTSSPPNAPSADHTRHGCKRGAVTPLTQLRGVDASLRTHTHGTLRATLSPVITYRTVFPSSVYATVGAAPLVSKANVSRSLALFSTPSLDFKSAG